MAMQDGAGERIRLAQGGDLATGALEAKGEATDAAEDVKDTHKGRLGR